MSILNNLILSVELTRSPWKLSAKTKKHLLALGLMTSQRTWTLHKKVYFPYSDAIAEHLLNVTHCVKVIPIKC